MQVGSPCGGRVFIAHRLQGMRPATAWYPARRPMRDGNAHLDARARPHVRGFAFYHGGPPFRGRSSVAPRECSRSTSRRRRVLPVAVLGRARTNSICCKFLYGARRRATRAISAVAATRCSSSSTTKPFGSSPASGDGRQVGEPLVASLGEAVLHGDVLAVHVADLAQPLEERLPAGRLPRKGRRGPPGREETHARGFRPTGALDNARGARHSTGRPGQPARWSDDPGPQLHRWDPGSGG